MKFKEKFEYPELERMKEILDTTHKQQISKRMIEKHQVKYDKLLQD